MALLRLVDDIPGIHYVEYRDKKYWGKYDYRLRVSAPGMFYLWRCSTQQEFDRKLTVNARGWGAIPTQKKAAMKEHYDSLIKVLEWKNKHRTNKDLTTRVEFNTLSIFSNDLDLLKTIESSDSTLKYEYTKAEAGVLLGVKYFAKEPKHKYRVYLRTKNISRNTC